MGCKGSAFCWHWQIFMFCDAYFPSSVIDISLKMTTFAKTNHL